LRGPEEKNRKALDMPLRQMQGSGVPEGGGGHTQLGKSKMNEIHKSLGRQHAQKPQKGQQSRRQVKPTRTRDSAEHEKTTSSHLESDKKHKK